MFLLDILDVSFYDLDSRLLGRSLDLPKEHQTHSDSVLVVEGWVVGSESPAVAIELIGSDGTFRRMIVGGRRPDVREHLQGARGSEFSGFDATLQLSGSFDSEFLFQAVLADGQRVPLAKLLVSRRWKNSDDSGERDLVSIVIPCYGQAGLLGEAIESALNQSYPHVEIVVVDDGSPDHAEIVARRYPGVRWVRQENRGLAAARNKGIQHARGDFLIFLDADDRLISTGVEMQMSVMQAHPEAALVYGQHRLISAGGTILKELLRPAPQGGYFEGLVRSNLIGCPAAALYRRSVFHHLRGFDRSFHPAEDYDLYLRIAQRFEVVAHEGLVAEYRRHGQTLSSDHVRMLNTVLRIIRTRAGASTVPSVRQAFRQGAREWREYYGRQITQQLADPGGGLTAVKRVRAVLALLRHHPRGLLDIARSLRHGRTPLKMAGRPSREQHE